MLHTRTFVPTLIALWGFALASARPAQCSEIVIPASADTFIMSSVGGAKFNFGNDPVLLAYDDGFTKMHSLLKFDLRKMETLAIRSVRLRLWSQGWEGDFSNSATTSIFALAAPWKENEACWYAPMDGSSWLNPGGDLVMKNGQASAFAVNTQGITIASGGANMMEWDVTQLVKLWTSGRLANNGLRIDAIDGIFLYESRQSEFNEMHPTLIITFGKDADK